MNISKAPFFTVVIPVYNRSSAIKTSVEGVLAQTFKDFELLIVDDGSTDNTAEVVQSFTDQRIKYIYQQNSERSAARNNGIRNAAGQYICLLDSDDIYFPEHLETLHHRIQSDAVPVAIYKTLMQYGNALRKVPVNTASQTREEAIRYVWANGSQLISVCFHSEIGKNVLFPESFFWFEDIHWIMRVVLQYPLKRIMTYTTYYDNKSTAHLLQTNYRKYLDNCIACIRDLEQLHGKEIKSVLGRNCFNEKIAEVYLGFIVGNAINNRQLTLARKYLLAAARTCITPRLLAKYAYYSWKLLRAGL